jgi:hypothetical protein
MSEEWRTAAHEASHAVAALLLGVTADAGPISIVPGETFDGVVFLGRPPRPREADLVAAVLPYPLRPARLRQSTESHVMAIAAGTIGEDLALTRGVPVLDPAPIPAAVLTPCPAVLPPRQQADLDQAAASSEDRSDLAAAMELLTALHGGDDVQAERHLWLLAGETEKLMGAPLARRMVRVLARELMVHPVLPAARWLEILGAARC